MPSFNGRKSGEGNPQLVATAMAYAEQQAYIHATLVEQQKLGFGQRTIPIPGGGYVVSSISATGLRSIHVVVGTTPDEEVVYRPLEYYSGMVFGGNLTVKSDLQLLLEYGETKADAPKVIAKLYSFYPETETVAKFPPHVLTEEEEKIEAKSRMWYDGFATAYAPVQVTKLAVKVYNGLEGMSDTAPLKYTGSASTYSHIRPTMFTGSMRKVVQFVMGIGKILQPTWYRTVPTPEGTLMTPFFSDRDLYNAASDADGTVQLRYDFRFDNCYGMYKEDLGDSKFRWWVLRVSKSLGIIAMPLPLDEVSVLPVFRTQLEDMLNEDPPAPVRSDLMVLSTFGGFPTGATFEPQIEAYIRAGQYLRLAKVEDLDDYTSATVWGDQIGWSFSYDGKLAKCVAYQDIDVAPLKVCRAVRDMTITFEIKTDTEFTLGILGKELSVALAQHLPTGVDAKLWHEPKLNRMTEDDAGTLLTALARATNDEGKFDPDKIAALLVTFENMQATPIGTGSAKLTTGGKWAFTPATQLFKTADLRFDMCPSVNNWPPSPGTALVAYGDYRAPAKGSKVPLYQWFTEDGREMTIWFDTGATGTYQVHTSTTERSSVEYQSRAASCYVGEQPITMTANDIRPNAYTEYKSAGQHHTYMGTSAANDISPEGYAREDWMLRKYVTGKNDGGPDKADIEYGSAYMVFGDAEAALEFNYHHHPSTPPWTTTYDLSTTGNLFTYDWNYNDGNFYSSTHRIVECWNLDGGYPSYCSRPANGIVGLSPGAWSNPFDHPVGMFVTNVVDGNWARKGDVAAWYGSEATPEIPDAENNAGTSAWSKRTTRVYSGGDVVSTFEDDTYVARDRAWLDILELQKSLYDPPEDSPFTEHEVRGSRNSFGKKSGSYMRGVNDYTYIVVGTQLHANQVGDMPCYVGVILDL